VKGDGVRKVLAAAVVSIALGLSSLGVTAAAVPGQSHRDGRDVSVSVGSHTAQTGDEVVVTGHVHPWSPGDPVTLQVRAAGHEVWKNLRTVRLEHSDLTVTDRVHRAGVRWYRLWAHPTAKHPGGYSGRAVKVVVYRLRPLTSLVPISVAGFVSGVATMYGGQTYPDSLITTGGDGVHTIDYDVRRCTAFSSATGVQNDVAGPVEISVSPTPGSPGRVLGPLGSGTYTWTLHRVESLRLSATTTGGAQAVFGTPSVYCPF
jgi:hypothetical protein